MVTIPLGYLVPEFPRQTHIFFWRECEQLRRLNIEPVLLSTRRPQAEACPHPFRDEAAATTHYVYPPALRSWLSLLTQPLGLLRALRHWARLRTTWKKRLHYLGLIGCASDLVRHAKRHGVRHVHVHSCADAALLAMFAHALGGITYSLTLHNPLANHGPHQQAKWQHASFGIVVANVFLAEVQQALGTLTPPLHVAPMGTDLQQFIRTEPYSPWTGHGTFRIFACGRLNPCKGHDLLIRAVQTLRREGVDATLAIAGEDQDSGTGQFRRELEATIIECGLADHVTLLGAVNEHAVRSQLAAAHVFVLASRTGEAMPVVLIEAMAMSLPTVASDVGGTKELVREGETGFIVAPGDIAALANALRTLATDPALAQRFSVAGRAMVETGFGSDRSARTIATALAQLHP